MEVRHKNKHAMSFSLPCVKKVGRECLLELFPEAEMVLTDVQLLLVVLSGGVLSGHIVRLLLNRPKQYDIAYRYSW